MVGKEQRVRRGEHRNGKSLKQERTNQRLVETNHLNFGYRRIREVKKNPTGWLFYY